MMWFPDLFERFSQYASLFPDRPAGVCEVSLMLANGTAVDTDIAVSLLVSCFLPASVLLLSVINASTIIPYFIQFRKQNI